MIRNYIVLAYRNLLKTKWLSLVNIGGLSMGLAAGILILNYVAYEQSYDNIHEKGERIYRVESQFFEHGELSDDWATASFGYASAMHEHFPDIEDYVRIDISQTEGIVRYEDLKYREESIVATESSFFSIFSFPLISGDPEEVLEGPNSVVITQSMASKYFGEDDPIGRALTISSGFQILECEVTGIIADFPMNSHFRYDFLISWATLPEWKKDFWYLHETYSYILLAPGADARGIEAAFPDMAEKYKTREALRNKTWGIDLVPLRNIHLAVQKQYEQELKGNSKALNALILAALAILVIAWINYINLTTTRSIERAGEVGIRKVAGATRRELLIQFMTETFVINSLSFALALLLLTAISPLFSNMMGKAIPFVLLKEPVFWTGMTVVYFSGIFLSGFYPAFVLSSIQLASTLTGKYIHSRKAGRVRKGLVIFQFSFAVVLITGFIILFKQLKYMENQALGVEIENVMAIKYPVRTVNFEEKFVTFMEELKELAGVSDVTISSAVPGMEIAHFLSNYKASDLVPQNRLYEMLAVDHNYISTYGLEILAGRDFSREFEHDVNRIILNEEAVKAFGFSSVEEAVGEKVILEGDNNPVEILGVIKNYHQQGLNKAFTPIILFMHNRIRWIRLNYISVNMLNAETPRLSDEINTLWNRFFSDSSFDYFYVDPFYDTQYRGDRRFNLVFGMFTAISILISILGLWTLVLFEALIAKKHISIRRVFGASHRHLFLSLSRGPLFLIVLSIAIGIPVSYLLMKQWLSQYSFRTDLNWWIFASAGIITLFITCLTIARQTYLAATRNPVDALKTE
jgi:putative ABC transport system permease protein